MSLLLGKEIGNWNSQLLSVVNGVFIDDFLGR